jgi:hypothetical protein
MEQPIISRPDATEYAPYYGRYIDQVPEGDVLEILEAQLGETVETLTAVPAERGTYRYAPEKWSLNQVMGHLCDTERVFAHRALWFSRADHQPLPGMEQDDYVAAANFDSRTPADLSAEFRAIRQATLALFRSMSGEMLARRGVASEVEFSVRSIPFILAGHERHHLEVLKERYL